MELKIEYFKWIDVYYSSHKVNDLDDCELLWMYIRDKLEDWVDELQIYKD